MRTYFVTCLEMTIPIMTVLWTYVDLGLQINQSITYYQHAALNDNKTYRNWESKYPNTTDQPYLDSVSPTYFYLIVVVWVATPTLGPLWICLNERAPIDSPNIFYGLFVGPCMVLFCMWPFCEPFIRPCTGRLSESFDESLIFGCPIGCILLFLYFIAALICFLVMVPAYYVLMPMLKVIKAFQPHKDPLWLKVCECRIEAIPQLILGTVYFVKNYGHVLEHEDNLGLPVTAISCIFSLGSVVIILITGLRALRS